MVPASFLPPPLKGDRVLLRWPVPPVFFTFFTSPRVFALQISFSFRKIRLEFLMALRGPFHQLIIKPLVINGFGTNCRKKLRIHLFNSKAQVLIK